MASCPLQDACFDAANATWWFGVRRAAAALGQKDEGDTHSPSPMMVPFKEFRQ